MIRNLSRLLLSVFSSIFNIRGPDPSYTGVRCGQLGFDVEHGSVIPETVEEQATLSLKNLDAIMTAAGTDRTKVMKTTIFLTDMNDFAKVNEVYGAFFGESKPARSCVAVAALPKAAKVEIECIVSLK